MGDGPPGFPQGSSCPAVLRNHTCCSIISLTGLSPTLARLSNLFGYNLTILCVTLQPRSTCTPVWASPRSLAATQGIIFIFSSWGYLDGSVHPVRLRNLCIQLRITLMCWVSPFGHPRINARLAAPRGFSQPSTSFIASCRQGIHQIHLISLSCRLPRSRPELDHFQLPFL